MSDLFGVAGRVAGVTGASAGIGQHLALSVAQAGAQVVAVARRREALETLAAKHGVAPVVTDLAAIEDFAALAQALEGYYYGLCNTRAQLPPKREIRANFCRETGS